MREKKTWRKTIPQEEAITALAVQNRTKEVEKKQSLIKDEDLFKINVDKKGL